MARYKDYSYAQTMMIPVSFEKQIIPGTFEYTLYQLIHNQIDMSVFENHYENDETVTPQVFAKQKTMRTPNIRHCAYDSSILLKIVLFAYSKGINSSRNIEQLCRENIICMALAADSRPHFTTIADFISSCHQECQSLFTMILSVCYSQGLIGKNMSAIDDILKEVPDGNGSNPMADMKEKIDTPYGRSVYAKRMSTVEPVFGHIAGMKKLNRFTLRGTEKVRTQWLLYCIVHNIGKIQRYSV